MNLRLPRLALVLALAFAPLPALAQAAPFKLPPAPAPLPLALLPGKILTSFDPGDGFEGVTADRAGNVYATLEFSGRVVRVTPDGKVSIIATLPTRAGKTLMDSVFLGTIAAAPGGTLYATMNGGDPEVTGLWQVAPGQPRRLSALPPGSLPNGVAVDDAGAVYIADSTLGTVWRWRPGERQASAWLRSDLLAPPAGANGFPGANGIKVFQGAVYVSNSSTGQILKIPVTSGGAPGEPSVVTSGLPADDLAFDSAGNLYAATHAFDTVVRIRPDGTKETVATAGQGVAGGAAPVVTRRGGREVLIVVTDGNLFNSFVTPGTALRSPTIIELPLTERGK